MLGTPLYRQVHDQIRQRISAGVYPRGSALPSETRLSQEFGVSQITVRRALHELALDGLVDRRQGIGNLVRDAARTVLVGLDSFTADVASGRLRLVRSLLADEMIAATDDVAERLQTPAGALLRHLRRLDTEGDTPIAVDDVYTPAALAAMITTEMAASLLFLSLWQARSGLTAYTSESEISAEMPAAPLRALLQVGPDVPVLHQAEVIRDETGRPLHFIISRYCGDRVRLKSRLQVVTNGQHAQAAAVRDIA